jgi:hypothetical protein
MTKIQNAIILLIILLFSGSCVSNSSRPPKDPEFVKRLNRVNEILDGLEKNSSIRLGGDSRMAREIIGEEYAYLIENSDIALPVMFKRLDNKKLSRHSLIVYFVVFEKTKSAESIPYIADYITSVSEQEVNFFYISRSEKTTSLNVASAWGVFAYALIAAGNIMYPHPLTNIPGGDLSLPEFINGIIRMQIGGKRTLFDERLNIANQLRKWYKEYKWYQEYKKTQDKK